MRDNIEHNNNSSNNNNNNNNSNNNNNNNDNNNNNNNNNIIMLLYNFQNYQKDTIKIMLQYLPLISQCTKKVRYTLNNHTAFAARFSKCFLPLHTIKG